MNFSWLGWRRSWQTSNKHRWHAMTINWATLVSPQVGDDWRTLTTTPRLHSDRSPVMSILSCYCTMCCWVHSCNNAMPHVTLPLTPTAMAWCLGEPRPCCTAICQQTVRGTHWLFVEKSETWELISGNNITWVVTLWVTLSGCRPEYYITSSTNDTQWRIFEYI